MSEHKSDPFAIIRESIHADIDAGEPIYVLEETEQELTIVDDFDSTSRAIRYVRHDQIDPNWIERRILVTQSAQQCEYTVSPKTVAEYLCRTVRKDILQTLERIVIIADLEADWDELFQLEDRHGNPILEVCDLPDDDLLGISWAEYQIIVLNLQTIIRCARCVHELDPEGYSPVAVDVNTAVATTLLHELFHMAQNDPYAPESLFAGLPLDLEQQAEDWANSVWDDHSEYILK